MKRVIATGLTILVAGIAIGFMMGLFVGTPEREESCIICRALRYNDRQYGVTYSRVEEGEFTRWYRENVDPDHGLDSDHPHSWLPSGCVTKVQPGVDRLDTDCTWIPPIFMVRPEVELAMLKHMPDK